MTDIRKRIFGEQITEYLTKKMNISRLYLYGLMYFIGTSGVILESYLDVLNAIGLVFILDFAYHQEIIKIPKPSSSSFAETRQ